MRILALALVAGLLASPALAAEKKSGCPLSRGTVMGMGQKPGKGGWHKMAKVLKLSEEQAAELKALREESRKVMKPLRRKFQDQKVELKRLLEDEASDREVEAQLKGVRATQKKIEAECKKHLSGIEAVLNPTQRAKFLLKMGRRFGCCMDCPMGWKPGMGGKPKGK